MQPKLAFTLPHNDYYNLEEAASPVDLVNHQKEKQLMPPYVFKAINRLVAENYKTTHRCASFTPDSVRDEMQAIMTKEQQRRRDHRFFYSDWYRALLVYVQLGWEVVLSIREPTMQKTGNQYTYRDVVLENEKAFDSLRGSQVTLSGIEFKRPESGDEEGSRPTD